MIFRNKINSEKLEHTFGKIKDDSFSFDLIEKYFRHRNNSNAFQIISDKTCNDLDFKELFMFIDRTHSKPGQQFLYNKLRVIPSDSAKNNNSEIIIDKLTSDSKLRFWVQSLLEQLKKTDAYYISSLFQETHQKSPAWFFIIPVLSFLSFVSIILMFFFPQFLLLLLGLFFVNTGIHYWNKKNLYPYLASIPQLLILNKVAREIYKNDDFRTINPELSDSLEIIDKIRNRMSFFKLEASLQGDLEAIFWGILELFKIIFLIEPLLLFGVLGKLDSKRKEIEDVFVFVGETDSLISVASLRNGLQNFCKPEILSSFNKLEIKNVYHPLIFNCIDNSISLNQKSVLLTGSNMSGKTSFIRTVGINVLTGLTLNTCFAEKFSMPKMKIFSAIRISDDLLNDKSYYFEEVLTIKEMIDNSKNGIANLFLLDEIYKGTNTVERISAGKAVLSSLSKNNNLVFVSTHDIELADLLKEEFELFHFSETVNNNTVDFDYKLKEGKLKNRNAIKILQINNYPESIIKEATKIAAKFDESKPIVQ